MCGIFFAITKKKIDQRDIDSALTAMSYRGPDASGSLILDFEDLVLSFGHVRLSIIDTDTHGDQPFFSECGQYILIYNGEIYNYLELKAELEGLGVCFRTHSDTEVLLQAYIEWGEVAFNRLEGMYAFVIYDKKQNKIHILRDPLGIKPLYISHDEGACELLVASEIKVLQALGIKPKVDRSEVIEFLLNNWLYEPDTGFSNIKKVLPGGAFIYNLFEHSLEQKQLFNILKKSSEDQLIDTLILSEVNQQLRSDVKLGTFFSGGNDSSLIAALVSGGGGNVDCLFSRYAEHDITESGIVDDYPYAKKIAENLGLPLTVLDFNFKNYGKDIAEIAKKLALGNEELNGDYTYLSSFLVSKHASEIGFKVMLSGMGADEIFGGYPRYLLLRYFCFLKVSIPFFCFFLRPLLKNKKSFSKKYYRLKSFFSDAGRNFVLHYSNLLGFFSFSEIKENLNDPANLTEVLSKFDSLNKKIEGLSMLKKALYLDSIGFLSHNFIVADKSSMKNSVELRVPLASPRLFNVLFHLPDNKLIRLGNTKYIIKKMLQRFLKKSDIYRKKTGFNPPLDSILIEYGEDNLKDLLIDNLSVYLKQPYLLSLIKEHFSRKKNNTYKLLQLIYLSQWLMVYDA